MTGSYITPICYGPSNQSRDSALLQYLFRRGCNRISVRKYVLAEMDARSVVNKSKNDMTRTTMPATHENQSIETLGVAGVEFQGRLARALCWLAVV